MSQIILPSSHAEPLSTALQRSRISRTPLRSPLSYKQVRMTMQGTWGSPGRAVIASK